MLWLAGGVVYSIGYVAAGWVLAGHSGALLWLRGFALLIPPVVGVGVIALRRREWAGCQWLFWATTAIGLTMSAIGLMGWTADELLLARETSWVGWYSVFALFGGVAPLFALLAQPHRGVRDAATASTAVDIAGIGVMAGFLYSHFVVGPDLVPLSAQQPSLSLLLLCEFQQLVVLGGMVAAALVARRQPWGRTYSRLSLGLLVQFAILTVSSIGIYQGLYRSGFVYDLVWILPFAFFPWAAATAPASAIADLVADEEGDEAPSRPWVVFGALAATPVLDYGLRQVLPLGPLEAFRDLFTTITVVSVLPLLMARLAVERSDARSADSRRRLLAAAIEQADDQIAILTADGWIEHANHAFCRAAGRPLHELAGTPMAHLLVPSTRSQFDVVLDTARTGGLWRGTLLRARPGGGTNVVATAMVGMMESSGAVRHLVSVERDVTDEARLREQLIHSERLAAIGQLVSGVAHELNNPLQSVVGFTELLLEAERREDRRSDLEHVRSEANRAAKIVRNLLSFAHHSTSDRERLDLNELVSGTLALREYDQRAAGIEVEAAYATDLPPVHVNREEIQQVLLNLILNAEQAMRGTGRQSRLLVRTQTAEGGVVAEVEDNGPGVPDALAGQIFEPFFTTKDVGEGTGLGLSIALGIAESHGGSLELLRRPLGACLRLTLPAASATASDAPAPRTRGWTAMNGRTALVADDQPALRELLQRMLTKRGFAVEAVPDGIAAAERLASHRYDVIFCDVQMPGLDGLSLYELMRRRQPHLLDAFVFMSGDELDPRLQRLVSGAHAPLLPKPFTATNLDEALTHVLAQRVG